MSFLSAPNLIRATSSLNLYLAYLLHTSPATITSHPTVLLLSSSMDLEVPGSLLLPSPALSFAAAIIAMMSFADLSSTGLQEEIRAYYWGAQAPLRFFFFGCLSVWAYASGPMGKERVSKQGRDNLMIGKIRPTVSGSAEMETGMNTGLVFTWGFVHMILYFWVYTKMRDEMRSIQIQKAKKKELENKETSWE
ncbi:hypothetical protein MMC25_001548 [Agyrium rufum]|nr:hypothetical protein [Agyrium rufum]